MQPWNETQKHNSNLRISHFLPSEQAFHSEEVRGGCTKTCHRMNPNTNPAKREERSMWPGSVTTSLQVDKLTHKGGVSESKYAGDWLVLVQLSSQEVWEVNYKLHGAGLAPSKGHSVNPHKNWAATAKNLVRAIFCTTVWGLPLWTQTNQLAQYRENRAQDKNWFQQEMKAVKLKQIIKFKNCIKKNEKNDYYYY